jgi:acyl carrier protein phosphodiesterase
MNYLAHAYLSFNHPGILAGNLFSDFVKGRKKFDFPADIQKGIALHRAIDTFTDTHDATREAKEVFRPHYRLYSGAFIDVVYDHFLAIDENEFPANSLEHFSRQVYADLEKQRQWFPERFAVIFPYMQSQNWLLNYQSTWGTEKSFGGLVHRSAYLTESNTAIQLFEEHYQLFQQCYRHFWAAAKPFARQQFEQLLAEKTGN